MPSQVPKSIYWMVVIIALIALIPIAAMTMLVAAVAWIPIVAALVIALVALMIRERRRAA